MENCTLSVVRTVPVQHSDTAWMTPYSEAAWAELETMATDAGVTPPDLFDLAITGYQLEPGGEIRDDLEHLGEAVTLRVQWSISFQAETCP